MAVAVDNIGSKFENMVAFATIATTNFEPCVDTCTRCLDKYVTVNDPLQT